MGDALSEISEEDGVYYLTPRPLDLARPPRDAGRFPRTTRELGCPYHPELVSRRSLVEALARGERREALLAFFEGSDAPLIRAFSSLILAPLYDRGEVARGHLASLLEEPRLTATQRAIVLDLAWNDAVRRERERSELETETNASRTEPTDPVACWATVRSTALGAHERREAFDALTRQHRATACELARELSQDRHLGRSARLLLRFPEVEALHAHLEARGLTPIAGAQWQPTVLASFSVLPTSRWLAQKDADPAEQASMLARLVGLDAVRFESIPALGADFIEEEDDAPIGERLPDLARLRAYFDGRCEEALLEGGRFVDLLGVVGLINTLLERRGDGRRWVFPEPIDEALEGSVLAVAWPLETIRALRDDGLL